MKEINTGERGAGKNQKRYLENTVKYVILKLIFVFTERMVKNTIII